MAVSFKYWDDCTEPEDMEALWASPDVKAEWISAGETKGSKIHLSRDPEGQAYLTQTEIKAVTSIVVQRYFPSQIDSDMLCAIATLQSDRQLLYTQYTKKSKGTSYGMMQILPKTAEWLARELGYMRYDISENPKILYRPFVTVYFAAAYLKWLSTFDNAERTEEFMVRAYKGGTKKAAHKSTLQYWKRYISVKESLPSSKSFKVHTLPTAFQGPAPAVSNPSVQESKTWDSRTSQEDMEAMWNQPSVSKEWHKQKEKKGNVRLRHDDNQKKPYLSRVELKAVAEIILSRHFSTKNVKPAVLCAICEMRSMRFADGVGQRVGLMGIDYPTAQWLYKDVGCKAYKVESLEDLQKPFVSMYFGAAYLAWLANYEDRERSPQFVVQAYLTGPQNVNLRETGPQWLKFEEALSRYQDYKKEEGSCAIL